MKIVGQCDIDEFCRKVLNKHWPHVPKYGDIKSIAPEGFAKLKPDIIATASPCQNISTAGRGEGLKGAKSSVWFDCFKVIQACRPPFVIFENVPAIRTRGIDTVLFQLEGEGYTCWPVLLSARAVGAPHRRERVWIIAVRLADAQGIRRAARSISFGDAQTYARSSDDSKDDQLANPNGKRKRKQADQAISSPIGWKERYAIGRSCNDVADACGSRRQQNTRSPYGNEAEDEGRPAQDHYIVKCSMQSDGYLGDTDSKRRNRQGISESQWKLLLEPSRPGQSVANSYSIAVRISTSSDEEEQALVETEQGIAQFNGYRLSHFPAAPSPDGHQFQWEPPRLKQYLFDLKSEFCRKTLRASRRLDKNRLKALGNCNPPLEAYIVGKVVVRLATAIAEGLSVDHQ